MATQASSWNTWKPPTSYHLADVTTATTGDVSAMMDLWQPGSGISSDNTSLQGTYNNYTDWLLNVSSPKQSTVACSNYCTESGGSIQQHRMSDQGIANMSVQQQKTPSISEPLPTRPSTTAHQCTASTRAMPPNIQDSGILMLPKIQQQNVDRNSSGSSPSALHQQTPSTCSLTSGIFSLPVSVRVSVLQLRFLNVPARLRHRAQDLYAFYKLQAANLASDRSTQRQATQPFPWLQHAVDGYYDYHHHLLISRVERSLLLIGETHSSGKKHHRSDLKSETQLRTEQVDIDGINKNGKQQHSGSTQGHMTSGQKCVGKNSRHLSPENKAERQRSIKQMKTKTCIPRDSRARFVSTLNPVAVKIMVSWYQRNKAYPYPSLDTCAVMAKAGDISVDQVKKWFANKRSRDNNTKSVNEVVRGRRRSRDEMEEGDAEFWSEGKRQRTE